ncbi:uncharacterized protein VTP21DRAFT_8117 [Calcarisporiella thermophila]|uniref:uncharacterized protein n=1 Tax=Calcarisporiella thermophila TaxID=911321 RepID=UPI00374242AD
MVLFDLLHKYGVMERIFNHNNYIVNEDGQICLLRLGISHITSHLQLREFLVLWVLREGERFFFFNESSAGPLWRIRDYVLVKLRCHKPFRLRREEKQCRSRTLNALVVSCPRICLGHHALIPAH